MSVAITNTHNTMGVRHLSGLRTRSFKANRTGLTGYITLGSAVDPDTVSALTAAGYDPITIQALQAQGASDQELLALPFGPGTTSDDMGSGLYALQVKLHGAPPPVNYPMNYSAAGFLYDPLVASTGPFGTLEQASQPGVNAQALQFASGPLGTALTPGPVYSSGSPSAPSLANTASSGIFSSLSSASSGLTNAFSSPQNFLQWIEANALWIALLAGAAIVLPPLIKKL